MTVAVPVPWATIFALLPESFCTVATFEFDVLHFRLEAFEYEPLLVLSDIVKLSPLPIIIDDSLSFTLLGADFTVTLQLAVLPL